MYKVIAVLFLLITVTDCYADVIRSQCQTEESRGLRLTSEAMYKAASRSEPNLCNGCSMNSNRYDMMRSTAERFRAEALSSLLKGRALEAARCPQWERAIMENGPATDEETAIVYADFEARMQKARDKLAAIKAWQIAHPQCKHVSGMISGGVSINGAPPSSPSYSKEDFSGNFGGKKGQCSSDGTGSIFWYGSEDDLTMIDPSSNDRIAQVACADALKTLGLGDGWYAEPSLCGMKKIDR